MTYKELVKKVSTKLDCSQAKTDNIIKAVFEAMNEGLVEPGDNLNIAGIGTFKVIVREARQGRHPRTGEILQIPRKSTLRFNPSSTRKNITL